MKTHLTLKMSIVMCALTGILVGCQKSPSWQPEEPVRKDTGTNIQAQANCDFRQNDSSLTANGWTKVFEDDFNAGLSQWKVILGGSDNNQLQCYQAANLVIKDGALHISVKRETIQGPTSQSNLKQKTFNFSSGAVASIAQFSASGTTPRLRIATRVKLPVGIGMTPTIYSFNNPWPQQGQIIILQGSGEHPNYFETNYHYGTAIGKNLVRDAYGFITTNMNLTDCYHVYEMEWTQNALKYYLDGNLVETKTSGGYISSLFSKSHHLFFVLAVDGAVPIESIQPGTLSIDWVKVFTAP